MLAGAVVQTSVPELNKLFGSCPHLEGHLADLRVEWEPFQVKDAVVFGIVPPQKDDAVLVTLVNVVFSGPETGNLTPISNIILGFLTAAKRLGLIELFLVSLDIGRYLVKTFPFFGNVWQVFPFVGCN